MKIVQLGYGNSAHIQRLAKGLSSRGHKVTILTGSAHIATKPLPDVDTVSFDSNTSFLKKYLQLKAILRDLKPDIVHSHYLNYGGYAALLANAHPHIASIWGDDLFLAPQYSWLHSFLINRVLATADSVLGVSDELTALALKKVPHCKAQTWHWGIDTSHFSKKIDRAKRFRQKLSIAENALVIYSPRLLMPDYYHDLLIESWPQVLSRYPDAVLVLKLTQQNQEYYQKLLQLITRLQIQKSVRWVESLDFDELAASYSASDLTVSLTLTDGTPMTVLESLACETPFFAINIPAVNAWSMKGKCGVLVDFSQDAITKGLCSTLDQLTILKTNTSQMGRPLVVQSADKERCLDQLEKIYQNIILSQ